MASLPSNTFMFNYNAREYNSSTTTIGEAMSGDYYWTYMTKRVLTDDEIQQVIDYNEGL